MLYVASFPGLLWFQSLQKMEPGKPGMRLLYVPYSYPLHLISVSWVASDMEVMSQGQRLHHCRHLTVDGYIWHVSKQLGHVAVRKHEHN